MKSKILGMYAYYKQANIEDLLVGILTLHGGGGDPEQAQLMAKKSLIRA